MNKKTYSLFNVLNALSDALDLVSETVVGHHQRVTYIAFKLGREMGLSDSELMKLIYAGFIHDIGAFYLNIDLNKLTFDEDDNLHAEVGRMLLRDKFPLPEISRIIKYHHYNWSEKTERDRVPIFSHIIHLADKVAIITLETDNILVRTDYFKKLIRRNSGKKFNPAVVEAFNRLAPAESFWLDTDNFTRVKRYIAEIVSREDKKIDLAAVLRLGDIFSHIIDFRSSFTATHSVGLACVSKKLARYFNYSDRELRLMELAGYLHDIGKLKVPVEVLNKPDKLNRQEWALMKTHTYYSYYILNNLEKLDPLKEWAAYHHEKLNGRGYPFRLNADRLPEGSRIMAVADVFTAITEDRPYRRGMLREKILKILDELAENGSLDGDITHIVVANFAEFRQLLEEVQKEAAEYYRRFKARVEKKEEII